ncbi:MAG: hypothetical protein P8168_11475 [Deltaproteobacteria bacterium]|jgi:hypothetical protein
MRSKRFLFSKKQSTCCSSKALLVQSRAGGLVSQNCLQCGKPDTVSLENLPDLVCDCCGSVLLKKIQQKNYFYFCHKCNRNWKLADNLPHWSELFKESGFAPFTEITE